MPERGPIRARERARESQRESEKARLWSKVCGKFLWFTLWFSMSCCLALSDSLWLSLAHYCSEFCLPSSAQLSAADAFYPGRRRGGGGMFFGNDHLKSVHQKEVPIPVKVFFVCKWLAPHSLSKCHLLNYPSPLFLDNTFLITRNLSIECRSIKQN